MCSSSPSVPDVPDRQAAKAPDIDSTTARTGDVARRRLALATSVFAGANGAMSTTPITTKTLLGQ